MNKIKLLECIVCKTSMIPYQRDLYQCGRCGLISSRYKADKLMYDEFYFDRYKKYIKNNISTKLNTLRRDLVYSYVTSGNILDYGCATGIFHEGLNSGIKGYGYDINPEFKTYSLEIIKRFKYIGLTFWDCLEHIDDPLSIIKSFDTKYLFISVPCLDDFRGEDIGQWRHYRPHEHVHYFNQESLCYLFNKLGYKVLEVNFNESNFRTSGGKKNILTVVGRKDGRY